LAVSDKRYVPGITLTSLAAMAFALLCAGILLQWDAVVLKVGSFSAEHSVPLPGIVVLVLLTAIMAVLWRLGRIRALTRAELLCILFAMLIALPLMTQGFWHRYLSMSLTFVDDPGLFRHMRGYPDELWPHGPNLLEGALDEANRENLELRGAVTWEPIELEPGRTVVMPVLRNDRADQVSSIRIRVPAVVDGRRQITTGEPFMVSVLARPGVEPDFALDSKSHIPAGADDRVVVELALEGVGRVAFAEPVMMSTDALVSALRGKRLVTQSQFDQLPPDERGGLVVKPDSMFSIDGIKFLLSGYIPVRQWVATLLWWSAFILLLLLAAFAINVLLRKQWMENERFQMPLTKIPMTLMGYGPDDIDAGVTQTGPMPLIWRNRMMWLGLAVAGVLTLLRAWHFYNPKVPDLNVYIHLKPYFNDPGYGTMWNSVYFMVSFFFVSIAMFMELNILLSIVVGFFAYRSMLWASHAWGIGNTLKGFPWQQEQQIGAYVTYAVVTLVFMRKYLWRVLKAAVVGDKAASEGEPLSYRAAVVMLIGSFALAVVWARSLGASVSGVLIMYGFLVVVALVTCKLRTECGAPFSYLGPRLATMALGVFGGIAVFGSESILFAMVISFMVGGTPFFLIPGAQMELIELGRRFGVRPKHLVATCVLGLVGGIFVGGWVFLSQSYGLGGRNMNYNWAYSKKAWHFTSYQIDHTNATSAYLAQHQAGDDGGADAPWWDRRKMGFTAGAILTAAVAVLRQIFPAFWFHPIGILLGASPLVEMIWGSCFVAWAIRLIVLHFGGAATVRKRLQPFFVGVFCGTLAAHLLLMAHSAYLQAHGVEHILSWWPYLVP